jgi:hypothetical protein
MNIFNVVASLAGAASALGVKVPPAITNTLIAAAPVIAEVSAGAPLGSVPSVAVQALLAAGVTVGPTGNAEADGLIAQAVTEISKYHARIASFEAGQPVILATATVSIKGVTHKAYTIEALDTSELVQGLGL